MNNPLLQYLSLYDASREKIMAADTPALNRLRDAARIRLEGARLPDRHDEGYEKTSLAEMFAPDFGININRLAIPMDVAESFRCDVPNLSTLLAVVANDTFAATRTLRSNMPEGVTVMSLAQAASLYPDIVGKYYGSAAADTVPVALNTLFCQDGVFIHLAPGVKVGKPIQIVNIFSAPVSTLSFRRILIVAEAGSSATILLCDHTQDRDNSYLSSQVAEVICGNGASVTIADLEESTPHTSRCASYFISQDEASSFRMTTATLLNGSTRNDFNVSLHGSHARAELFGMAIGSGSQHIDNYSGVRHLAPSSKSEQKFKYVLDDLATGAFEGGIEVAPGAYGTEAYQSNKNVLANTGARMHTKPQLLIFNDDVKCSHGASTGQLDASALFYMQTRGIPLAEARTMLMQAFMTDIITSVTPDVVADRLRHLVEKRFAGTLATCRACKTPR